MRPSRRSRGFTLLELLVGAAVGFVVLLGISLTFISQARQYQVHASRRGLQANARQAMAFMERHLRVAGYGVNPDRAIIAYDSYDAVNDTYTPGHPDAFVVHWRDELFHKRAAPGLSDAVIPLTTPLSEPLRKGQILLVLCGRGNTTLQDVERNPPHRYVTVKQYVDAGSLEIPLDDTAPDVAPNSPRGAPGRLFHEQLEPGFSHICFSNAEAHVLLIHRAAFYVAMFNDNGLRTPYLMMHKGLDMPSASLVEGDGTIDANDAVPVAEGIEQLQVAYILNTHPGDTDNTPIILGVNEAMGDTHYGENWERIDSGDTGELPTGWYFNIRDGDPTPPFTAEEMSDKRLADHPANIRQVRLTLVSRSTVPDQQMQEGEGDDLLLRPDKSSYPDGEELPAKVVPWRHLENLTLETLAADFKPQGGRHYRIILREAVTPKNMLLNRQFAPMTHGGG